jgi:hypothetical protein
MGSWAESCPGVGPLDGYCDNLYYYEFLDIHFELYI